MGLSGVGCLAIIIGGFAAYLNAKSIGAAVASLRTEPKTSWTVECKDYPNEDGPTIPGTTHKTNIVHSEGIYYNPQKVIKPCKDIKVTVKFTPAAGGEETNVDMDNICNDWKNDEWKDEWKELGNFDYKTERDGREDFDWKCVAGKYKITSDSPVSAVNVHQNANTAKGAIKAGWAGLIWGGVSCCGGLLACIGMCVCLASSPPQMALSGRLVGQQQMQAFPGQPAHQA